jgi:CubicO group peptidase (beta-lactamase class C family)
LMIPVMFIALFCHQSSAQISVAAADSIIGSAMTRGEIPGAVFLVSIDGKTVFKKAYGYAQLYEYGMKKLEKPEPMTTEHQFDLASMTKVLATTMSMMLLVDRDLVHLGDPVKKYLPEFTGPSKDSITIRHLLTHSAGLYQWQPLYLYARNKHEAFKEICRLPLQSPVGKQRRYSDLGFMLLGYIIEKVSGSPLDQFVKENLYQPLGLRNTLFNPLKQGFTKFAATSHGNPYEYKMVADTNFGYRVLGDPSPDIFKGWRHYTLKGETNDGNSFYANEGVAGHAGLFSTVDDMSVLFNVILNDGMYDGRRYYKKTTIDQFLEKNEFNHGLGWQLYNVAGRSEEPIPGFGHNGFTGTNGIAVPKYKLVMILLTNRQNVGQNDKGYYSNTRSVEMGLTQLVINSLKNR